MEKSRHVTKRITRLKTIVTMIAVISVLGIVVSTAAFFRPGDKDHPSKDVAVGAASSKSAFADKKERVIPTQTIRFTLYPEGIYPRKASAHKGAVAIAIEDLVGAGSTLVVERINGNGKIKVGQVRRFENHWRGRSIIELHPGRYRLSIAERPDNEAELTVEP